MTALEAELLPLDQETKDQEVDSILVQEMTVLETTVLEVDSTLVQETTDQDLATEALVQHQNPATTIVQALDPTLIMSTVITTDHHDRYDGPRYDGPDPYYHHDHFAPRPYGPRPVYHRYIDHRARIFYIDDTPYYSYGGVYYQYVPSYGYQEIEIPQEVVVSDLPYGARRVYVNEVGYYEADGMWFQPIDDGYMIVERPVASVRVSVPVPRPHISFHASFGF
jgi:hypothetical protein